MGRFSPFKQGFLGGLIVMAVLALVFSASGLAAFYNARPESDVTSQLQTPQEPTFVETTSISFGSPTQALIVFTTNDTYNGAGPAGYGRAGMHTACQEADPAAHFCSILEIENAWKTNGVVFASSAQSWIDNAVLGTNHSDYAGDVSTVSDWYGGSATGDYPYNCNAWTISSSTGRGLILNSGAISYATESCDDIHPITCCKVVVGQFIFLPLVQK